MNIKYHKNITGFSLVEIAIVLIIMSALITVTLVASDLKKSSDIRALINEIEEIHIALNNFYDLYNTVPGDTDVIYKYWASKCSSSSFCNGDGDNIIEAYKESHLVWVHLLYANLFKGNFTGLGDGDSQTQTAGINVPESALKDGQYSILHYHWPEFPDEHIILLGAKTPGNIGHSSVIDANSAFDIDTKLDDGKPSTGVVYGRNGWQNNNWTSSRCLINNVGTHIDNNENHEDNVEYDMNIATNECIMGFRFKGRMGSDSIRTTTD